MIQHHVADEQLADYRGPSRLAKCAHLTRMTNPSVVTQHVESVDARRF
jgi:hypothetical protein